MMKNIFVKEFLPIFLHDLPPHTANEWVMLFLNGAKARGLDDDEVQLRLVLSQQSFDHAVPP